MYIFTAKSCWEMTGLSATSMSCDRHPIMNRFGDIVGYPLDTVCKAPCPLDNSRNNEFTCKDSELFSGGDDLLGIKCTWMFSVKNCPRMYTSVARIVSCIVTFI